MCIYIYLHMLDAIIRNQFLSENFSGNPVDYVKIFWTIFVKLCRIIEYSYGKCALNIGVDSSENGWQAAMLDFCYNTDHRGHTNTASRDSHEV